MSAATDTDVDILEGLDFEPTLPCEHHQHDEVHIKDQPASWHAILSHPECKHTERLLICDSGRVCLSGAQNLICGGCQKTAPPVLFSLIFLPLTGEA